MQHPPSVSEARISEIFSSLQGEGIHVGERHLFVRFEECNMSCQYCDEWNKAGIEISIEETFEKIRRLEEEEGPHSYVSFTGGEPLLYVIFLKPLIQRIKAENLRIYLETNGTLWQDLGEVIPWCDCVAMDMKPPSVSKENNFDAEYRRFLQIAKIKETFVKIVLSKEVDIGEFKDQIRIVADVDPSIPVILQPVSLEGQEGHEDADLMVLLLDLQKLGSHYVKDIRVIPRLHRILKLR